jgi:hypothetical protein
MLKRLAYRVQVPVTHPRQDLRSMLTGNSAPRLFCCIQRPRRGRSFSPQGECFPGGRTPLRRHFLCPAPPALPVPYQPCRAQVSVDMNHAIPVPAGMTASYLRPTLQGSDQRANKRTPRRALGRCLEDIVSIRGHPHGCYARRRPYTFTGVRCKPARESADGGDALLTPFEKSLCSCADPSLWPRKFQIKEKNIRAAVDSKEGSVLESLCRFQDRA